MIVDILRIKSENKRMANSNTNNNTKRTKFIIKDNGRFIGHPVKTGYSREYLPYVNFKPSIPIIRIGTREKKFNQFAKNYLLATNSGRPARFSSQRSKILNPFRIGDLLDNTAKGTKVSNQPLMKPQMKSTIEDTKPNKTKEIGFEKTETIESENNRDVFSLLSVRTKSSNLFDVSELEKLENQAKSNFRQSRVFFKGPDSEKETSFHSYSISDSYIKKMKEQMVTEFHSIRKTDKNWLQEFEIDLLIENDLLFFTDMIKSVKDSMIDDAALKILKRFFVVKLDDSNCKVDQLLDIINRVTFSGKEESEDEFDDTVKNALTNYCAAPEKGISWKRLEGIFAFYFEEATLPEVFEIYRLIVKKFLDCESSLSIDKQSDDLKTLLNVEPDLVYNLFVTKLLQTNDFVSIESCCSFLSQAEVLPLKILLTNKRWRFSSPSYDLSRSYGSKYNKMAKRVSSYCSLVTVVSNHSETSIASLDSLRSFSEIVERMDSDVSNKFLMEDEDEINFYDLYMKFLYSKTNDVEAIIRNAFDNLEKNKASQKEKNLKTMKYDLLTNIINTTLRELAPQPGSSDGLMTEYDKSISKLKAKVVEDVACDLYNVYMTYLSAEGSESESHLDEHTAVTKALDTDNKIYRKEKKPYSANFQPVNQTSRSEQIVSVGSRLRDQDRTDTFDDAFSLLEEKTDSESSAAMRHSLIKKSKKPKLMASTSKDANHESIELHSFYSFENYEFEFVYDYKMDKLQSELIAAKNKILKEDNKHELLIKRNLRSSTSSMGKPQVHHQSFDDFSAADYSVPNEFIFDISQEKALNSIRSSKVSVISGKSTGISSAYSFNIDVKPISWEAEQELNYLSLYILLDVVLFKINLITRETFQDENKISKAEVNEFVKSELSLGVENHLVEKYLKESLIEEEKKRSRSPLKTSMREQMSQDVITRRSILRNSMVDKKESIVRHVRESQRLSLKVDKDTEPDQNSATSNTDNDNEEFSISQNASIREGAANRGSTVSVNERRSFIIRKLDKYNDSIQRFSSQADQLETVQSVFEDIKEKQVNEESETYDKEK